MLLFQEQTRPVVVVDDDRYWNLVNQTLTEILARRESARDEPSSGGRYAEAIASLRSVLRERSAAEQLLLYHVEPLTIACDIAGVSATGDEVQRYLSMRDEIYGGVVHPERHDSGRGGGYVVTSLAADLVRGSGDHPDGMTDRALWQSAREQGESRRITAYSQKDDLRRELEIRWLDGDDRRRQELRLGFLDHVLSILATPVGRIEALEIWLAGVDQHNRALGFPRIDRSHGQDHEREVRQLFAYLDRAVREIADGEMRDEVRRSLGIIRHNMESQLRHDASR